MQGLNCSSKDTIEPASRRLSYLFLAGILFFKEQKKGFGAPLLILTDSYSFSAPSHQENLESSSSARGKHSLTLPLRKAFKSRFLLSETTEAHLKKPSNTLYSISRADRLFRLYSRPKGCESQQNTNLATKPWQASLKVALFP